MIIYNTQNNHLTNLILIILFNNIMLINSSIINNSNSISNLMSKIHYMHTLYIKLISLKNILKILIVQIALYITLSKHIIHLYIHNYREI